MSQDKELQTKTLETEVAALPTMTPVYDIAEAAEEYVITMQIPGVDRQDVETVINGDDLVVTARRSWKQPETWKLLHEEIPAADYRLVLRLDHRVNRNALNAHMRNGILTVKLPKAEEVKPRRIEIGS